VSRPGLEEGALHPDPIVQFEAWFEEAVAAGQPEPEAMALATASPAGIPSVRFVLLRGVSPSGFVFYTNFGSAKGHELGANPRAALAFRWGLVDRQVRVAGSVGVVVPEIADRYFAGRARASQIGAWASDQSRPLVSRQVLLDRADHFEATFEGRDVPRPRHWGGFQLVPEQVEFWQQGANRLHDRVRYVQAGGVWRIERLNP
jgi:pyridoxamine 5'-phosphate oxidase